MKKAILSMLLPLFIVAAGCSGRAVTPVTAFTADFTAEYRGLEPCGRVSVSGAGYVSVALDSPETLRGMSARYRGGELSLSLDGLRCTADEAYLPDGAFFSLMKRAVTELGDPESRCEYELDDRGCLVSARLEDLSVRFANVAEAHS